MQPQTVFSIRDRHKSIFHTILSPTPTSKPFAREWRVLISDTHSRIALTSLFTPSDLRRYGITLHTEITRPRGPVPDIPALYVISPTPENIAWLLRDLTGQHALYDRANICFTSPISKQLLMALAAQLPVPAPVGRLWDLYSDFVALEHHFFTLDIHRSYARMKAVNSDPQMNAFVHSVVSGLFSVLLSLGVVPIIRSQRGGAAEVVSAALDRKLRDNLELFQKAKFSSRALSFRRPLLLMLDRDFDFNALLHHTWKYQALVHDCLKTDVNSVTVSVNQSQNVKTYALHKDTDFFWRQNASSAFPQVAEAIEKALASYRADVEEINANAGGASKGDDASVTDTAHLAAAISNLPELSKRKETIDVHTNIASSLLENINRRALDIFFELESQIMANAQRLSTAMSAEEYKAAIVELLKGVTETSSGEQRGAGTPADRLRLFLIYYSVFGGQLPESSMVEFRNMLRSANADTQVIEYVGKLKGYQHTSITAAPVLRGTLNTAKLKGLMTKVVSRSYRSITNVAQNAKSLITEDIRSFAVSRTLSMFMSEQARAKYGAAANAVLDDYLMFDPKVMPTSSLKTSVLDSDLPEDDLSSTQKMHRMLFSDAIVFTVGGSNYVEYENCMETNLANSSAANPKNILFGTTELVTSEGFLQQLSDVAKASR